VNAHHAQSQLLNAPQKNALRISLMLVEKGMLEVERLLAVGEYHGLLFRIIDDVNEDTRTSIRQLIHEVLKIIRELKDRFQLDEEVERKSRAIFGKAPLLWEIVTGTDAGRLRGYGEIDPRLKEALDPSIVQLSHLLLGMHQLVSKNNEEFVRNRLHRDGE
jgi:hypothetical protein